MVSSLRDYLKPYTTTTVTSKDLAQVVICLEEVIKRGHGEVIINVKNKHVFRVRESIDFFSGDTDQEVD